MQNIILFIKIIPSYDILVFLMSSQYVTIVMSPIVESLKKCAIKTCFQ